MVGDELTVLLIDDNAGDVRLIREMLRDDGLPVIHVEAADTLAGGLAQLESARFDAALLDLGLPDSQHLGTLAKVRQAAPDVPVVVLTGNDDLELPYEAVRQGAQDYLVKGQLDEILLARTIRYAIERARSLEALRDSEERFRRLYERVAAGVFEIDAEGRITSANPALVDMLDCESEAEVRALDIAADVFRSPDDFRNWFDVLRRERRADQAKLELQSRTGRRLVVVAAMHAAHDRAGRLTGYQGLITDITELDRLSQRLSYEASHDSLTGLFNRLMFEAKVNDAVERARNGARYALCYADLDQFRIVTETCGQVAGSELLKRLGETLQAASRRGEVLARLGGDEFGLLFEIDDDKQALARAQAFLATIEDFRFVWRETEFDTTASVGMALIDEESTAAEEMMGVVDAACHAAKELGGGRVYVGEPGAETLNRRISEMQWIIRIKAAISENRLLLYHQPIASVHPTERTPLHFEVLVRKVDKRGRIHTPGAFLPAVERYNVAATLDRWVIDNTLQWIAKYGAQLGSFRCSINLSGQSVGEPPFLDFIEERLETLNVPAANVCFEITESAAIRNMAAAEHLMNALRRRGCRFSLDDFGSGLSSFAYLRSLDVDYVKLDGLFTKSIRADPIDRATVKSIAELVRAMGKETIAEFVEDQASIEILRGLGVDYVQGFAVGPPAPIDELLRGRAAVGPLDAAVSCGT